MNQPIKRYTPACAHSAPSLRMHSTWEAEIVYRCLKFDPAASTLRMRTDVEVGPQVRIVIVDAL